MDYNKLLNDKMKLPKKPPKKTEKQLFYIPFLKKGNKKNEK